jgi:glycosyltransferase involved in cell wall biosynthesis
MDRLTRRSGFFSGAAFDNLLATADRVKRRGGKFVWTAHNVTPHEPPPAAHRKVWERSFARILERLDLVVCMSDYGARLIREAYPELDCDFAIIPHPHYAGVYRPDRPRPQSRAELGLDAADHLLVSIGLVRRYKNLPGLIERFRAVRRPNERLLIAGKCYEPALAGALQTARGDDQSVTIIDKTLTDAELADLYQAADVAISNGEGVLNSGAVLTAISLGKPVIAPGSGSVPEIQAQVGATWCILFDPPLGEAALREAMDTALATSGSPDLRPFDPLRIGQLHLNAYRGGRAE